MRELRLDRHWWRSRNGNGLVAGTPGTFFRLTEKGSQIVDSVEAGHPAADSPLVDRLIAAGAVHPVPGVSIPVDQLTVVIPTFARSDDDVMRVRALVAALAPLPVVVVDDASPVTVDVDARRVVRLGVNSGPGAARNAGVREVATPFVAFIDDDVEVTADQVLELSGHFTDPNVACVAPRVSTDVGRTFVSQYEAVRSPLDMGPAPARVRPGSLVPYVPSAVLVARTSAVTDAFDESLRFGEDVEFEWRSVSDSAQCRYEPTVVCRHPARPSIAAMLKQRFQYGRSAADIDKRLPWSVAPIRGNLFHVLPLALLLAGQAFWAIEAAFVSVVFTFVALRRMGLSSRKKSAIARLSIAVSSRHVATAVTREWWPLFLVFSAWQPVSFAYWLAASGLVLVDIVKLRPVNIAAFVPLRLLDNIAYGAGVWAGAVRTRSVRCLLPRLSVGQRRGG
jgi:mycofactocin system glycosyltransferase